MSDSNIGLTEAAIALQDHFGERLEADQDEGPRLMVQALQDDLGLSAREARELVQGLRRAGSVRFVEAPMRLDLPPALGIGGQDVEATSPVGMGPVAAARPGPGGYWQL